VCVDRAPVTRYARQQLLSTAAAVGIAGVFGAPFGGLLFSIEVTSTYYPMHSYFSSFVAALAAALTFITYASPSSLFLCIVVSGWVFLQFRSSVKKLVFDVIRLCMSHTHTHTHTQFVGSDVLARFLVLVFTNIFSRNTRTECLSFDLLCPVGCDLCLSRAGVSVHQWVVGPSATTHACPCVSSLAGRSRYQSE
jgi:hypothetical protein